MIVTLNGSRSKLDVHQIKHNYQLRNQHSLIAV